MGQSLIVRYTKRLKILSLYIISHPYFYREFKKTHTLASKRTTLCLLCNDGLKAHAETVNFEYRIILMSVI